MSSHHFVREGQEPALFILDNMAFHYAEALLEWVPLVMVADQALEQVLQWQIKIDVVLQHHYGLEMLEDLTKDQGPVDIVRSNGNDPIATGLQYLIENGYDSVNLLGRTGEDLLSQVERLAPGVQVGIYGEREKWSLISTGKFEKWMPAESSVLIRNKTPIQTEGIVQNGAHWEMVGAGIVVVRSESPFWIGERP